MKRINQAKMLDKTIDALNLHCGIDTDQIRGHASINFTQDEFPYAHKAITRQSDDDFSYYVVNPNKAVGSYIETFSEYRQAMDDIFHEFPLPDAEISRIDYRFDDFSDSFDALLKLNTLVLLLISQEYKVDNRYYSVDPLTMHSLTIRIQNRSISAENYNKAIENTNVDDVDNAVQNRLELRTKKLSQVTDTEPLERRELLLWFDRLDKSITVTNLARLTDTLNENLIDAYRTWREKDGKGFSVNAFFCEYRNSIYTREQFVQLHNLLEIPHGDIKVRDYMRRHDIQLFDYANLEHYRDKLKETGRRFLNS